MFILQILSNDRSKFNAQPDTGVPFSNGKDYVVFKTHSVAVEFLVSSSSSLGDF